MQRVRRLALTTLVCNDRECLFVVLQSLLKGTTWPDHTTSHYMYHPATEWVILAQGCSKGFVQRLEKWIAQHTCEQLSVKLIVWAVNQGLSMGVNELAYQTEECKYVLHIEDDFALLPPDITNCDQDWLSTCCDFMDQHSDVASLFLRQYATDQEKHLYGWTRNISYRNHRFAKDNFHWSQKIKLNRCLENPLLFGGMKFEHIPHFLFTFNPVLRRNTSYEQKQVFPVPTKQDAVAGRSKEWKATREDAAPEWGHTEAMTMEKTRDLVTYNVQQGLFGHYEDWLDVLEAQR